MNELEYLTLTKEVREAATKYYTDGTSPLTDAEFDQKMVLISEYEAHHEVDNPLSSTVGAGLVVSRSVTHNPPMLSLDNVFNETDLNKVLNSWRGDYEVEPKLDGLAMCIRYEEGDPVQMLTRGDGRAGEDVTKALDYITNLPSPKVRFGGKAFTGEVRGEVIFSVENFEKANAARIKAGGVAFANPRNAAAGCVNKASRGEALPARTYLSFLCYDAVVDVSYDYYSFLMRDLEKAGFTTARSILPEAGWNLTTKPDVGYEVDGLVYKANSMQERNRLGSSSRAPRWARAYKYPATVAHTRITWVEWNVGRTGVVTPRALVEPVDIGGVTITAATLNNPYDIKRKGLKLWATVEIQRAAEVIPEIRGLASVPPTGEEEEIQIPTHCPECKQLLDTSQARLQCPSKGECRLSKKIEYAVSRDALDIDGFSAALAEAMVEGDLVDSIGGLFHLSEEDISTLPTGRFNQSGEPILVGPVVGKKIYNNLQKAIESTSFERVLISMGIPGTGRTMSKRLAQHFKNMQALSQASAAQLMQVDKMGEKKAQQVYDALRTDFILDSIHDFQTAGLSMQVEESTSPENLPLEGMNVVLTGSFQTLGTRTHAASKLESLGATVGSSVSLKTSLVIADDPHGNSSKIVKARKLGVPVLDEEAFIIQYLS